jgi:hypothetical protein
VLSSEPLSSLSFGIQLQPRLRGAARYNFSFYNKDTETATTKAVARKEGAWSHQDRFQYKEDGTAWIKAREPPPSSRDANRWKFMEEVRSREPLSAARSRPRLSGPAEPEPPRLSSREWPS